MPPPLILRTFGGLLVSINETPVGSFGARTAEALLVYLACHQKPLPRKELAEFLWPERQDEVSQGNLRAALHRLRQKLGPYLLITRHTIALTPAVRMDTLEFEAHVADRRMAEALGLYQGAFLAGFYLDQSPAFEGWIATEQEHFHGLAVVACQDLLNTALELGRHEVAIQHARQLLALEPLHEATYRILMRLLAEAGQRAAALEQFDVCRTQLEQELGLALAPATLRLAEAIRRGEHLDAHPPLVTTAVKHINLPDHSLPLIGREEDLALIAGRLTNPDCRLITLTGPGGIGKTRLAIEAARRALATFVNGVCFIPLAGVRAPEFILSAVAQSFGLGSLLGGDVESYMLAYLREKRILVVLDSFEHLLEGSQHVIRLLRHAPGVKVLVTSRERLHLSEEWLLPLSGLPVEGAAMNLFQQRATRADPSFDATRQHAAIYDICDLVEGLPLALELAAAWVDTLSCERIAQEIRLNASFLSAVRRDAPDRHQGTRHLIDHSWNLLSPTLRSVFMRLSVFRSGFGIREGQFVADASLGQLKTLVEKSLLRSSRDRFDLHELIRQYAADRLSEAGEADTTARRHFAAYLNLADEARLHLLGRDQLHWMARLERESDNFRAALGWAFASHHEAGRIAQLVSSLAWYWRFTNKLEEAKGWLERALNLDGLTSADQAALLCHMGHNAWMRSDFYAAERYFKASLEDCYDFGGAGRHDAAYAQTGLAMTRYFQAEYLEARVLFEASLVDFQALRDAWWTACCYGWLGKVFAMLGDRDAAKQVNEECLKRFRSLGNPLGLGLFLPSAARLQLERGNIVEARQLTEEARVLLEQLDFRHPLGAIYHLLGVIERLEGRRAEADRHFRKGVTLYREMGQVVLAQDLLREVEDQSTWLN